VRGSRSTNSNSAPSKAGLERGIQNGIDQISSLWLRQESTYKSLVLYQGRPAARFRFTADQAGISIVDLALRKNSQGKVRIVGFYNHALGYDMVEQARRTAARSWRSLTRASWSGC